MLYMARRYDEAIDQIKHAIEMDPDFWQPHLLLGQTYTQKKMYPEAIAECQKARDLSGGGPLTIVLIGHALAMSGRQTEALAALAQLKELSKQRYFSPYRVAAIHAGLGDLDNTFEWLERGFERHDASLIWLKVDPVLDSVRHDPRFSDLARRVGLDAKAHE
jgi:tetratricopeptide (TPR) repeat protein